MIKLKSIQENRIDGEKLNRSGRTKKQQVIYRTLYMLATDYIRSDENAKYRDANPYTKIELADKLLELANKFDWKCAHVYGFINMLCVQLTDYQVSFVYSTSLYLLTWFLGERGFILG